MSLENEHPVWDKDFVDGLDQSLLSLVALLRLPNLEAAQKKVRSFLDGVTGSFRNDGRAWAERHKILRHDWERAWKAGESFCSPFQWMEQDRLLTHEQSKLLTESALSLIEFVLDGTNWKARGVLAAKAIDDVENYLAERGFSPEGRLGPASRIIAIKKNDLATALGLSATTLRTRLKAGTIRLHGNHKKGAKLVRLDVMQFSESNRIAILLKVGMDA